MSGSRHSRIAFCIGLAALLGAAAPAWAFRAANYFPLFNNPPAAWSYNVPTVGTVDAVVELPTYTVNGVTVRSIHRITTPAPFDGSGEDFQYFTNDADGIRLHQEIDPAVPTGLSFPSTVSGTVTFSPPLRYLAAEANLFDAFGSSGTVTFVFGPPLDTAGPQILNYEATSTVQAVDEPVTVPAGSFNAVRLFTTLRIHGTLFPGDPGNQNEFDQTSTQTIWAVKDLGIVQEVDDADPPAQLVSWSVPALTPSTGTVTFGRTPVGITSAPQLVTLSNTGTTLNVVGPSIQVSGDFAISSNTCGPVVAQGSPCTVGITFSPSAPGTRNGTALYYIQNDNSYPHQVLNLAGGAMYTPRDFGGNGKSDVLWQNRSTGTVVEWQMNGLGIGSSGSPTTVADLNWQVVGEGDFDGDGKVDVLWQHRGAGGTGQLVLWLMNGMAISSSGSPNTVADLNWQVQGVGDFDGDGKADVLWQNRSTGQVVMWLMNGLTISSSGSPNTVADLAWQVQGIGDFNGDGRSDILWQNRSSGTVVAWLMNGQTITTSASPTTVADLRWQVQGVGDFDGDGKADVLWQHRDTGTPGTGTAVVWLMNGAAIGSSGSPTTVADMHWQVQGVGDYDGDGKADVLWQHRTAGSAGNGQVVTWLMNGIPIGSSGSPNTVADLNWMVQNPK